MHSLEDIIAEVSALSEEDRAMVIDSLLRTLNPPDPDIDRAWSTLAMQRLDELRSGRVKPIPGDEVFSRIKERFGR